MNITKLKKYALLFTSAIIMVLFLSSCYMEPDRTIDNTNNIGNDGQNFDPIITPTPTASPTPVVTDTPVPQETTETTPPSDEPQESSGLNLGVFDTPTINTKNKIEDSPNTSIPAITKKPTQTKKSKTTAKPKVTPKPTSKVTKAGVEGSRVKELQQRLKRLGYYKGSVDGKYGQGTEDAIKDFQKNNKLNSDGIAGNATLKKLYSNNAKKAVTNTKNNTNTSKNKNSNSKAPRPTEKLRLPNLPSVPKNKYISTSSSSTGADVRNLQNRLIDLGYLAGTADGVYGAATEKAIKAFQRSNAPYVDGVAGPETLALLYSKNAKKASRPVAVVAKPGSSLRLGDEGPDVRALQARLRELNYLKGSVDGSYGEATKQAVMKFQNDKGINADGIAGSDTLNLMYTDYPEGSSIDVDSVVAKELDENVQSTLASSTGFSTININDSGDNVLRLQGKLKDLGYYKGENSGRVDEDTREAIMSFQEANHLTVDGKAGPTTQRFLYGNVPNNIEYEEIAPYSSGDNVFNLQYTLYELGYLQQEIDGKYNEYTLGAVAEFQGNNGLSVDGIANPNTLSLVYSSFAKPASLSTANYKTLNMGSDGEDVISLQERLKELKYFNPKVNAIYDNNTQMAVLSFQTYNGLNADGIADAVTQTKLYSETALKRP